MAKQLVFMRVDRLRKRGQICTTPFPQGFNIGTDDSFIVVDIDVTQEQEEAIPDGSTIELVLPPLVERYPDTTEQYVDEEGNDQGRVVYGYFSEIGNNSGETPMITLDDLTWEGKDE